MPSVGVGVGGWMALLLGALQCRFEHTCTYMCIDIHMYIDLNTHVHICVSIFTCILFD